MSRWYRIIGIPLPEVETLMKESSLKQVLGRMQETALSLEDEIKQKTMLLNKMNDIHKELRELESSLYTCKLKQLPGMYRLKQTDKNALLKNDIVKSLVNSWMDLLPYAFYSFRIVQSILGQVFVSQLPYYVQMKNISRRTPCSS